MQIVVAPEPDPATRRRLLESLTARLPQWFGQEDSNRHYAEQVERLDGWVARREGKAVGLLLLKRHEPMTAEIYWLGVDPEFRRSGVGRALIDAAEVHARAQGVRTLTVMTLHPDVDYEPYRRTRAFYEDIGFFFSHASSAGPVGPSTDLLACYCRKLGAP